MRKAFTLIELLVVIAIIAILAAILFPVFAQAKEAAKKTTTLSSTKQIATAGIMYSGDFDDRLPQSSVYYLNQFPQNTLAWPYPAGWQPGWDDPHIADIANAYYAESIQPYMKNRQLTEANGMSEQWLFAADSSATRLKQPNKMGINFNGLLHTYSGTAMDNPSLVPLFWTGRGAMNVNGRAYANPALRCITGASPGQTECSFQAGGDARNAGTHSMWFWNPAGQPRQKAALYSNSIVVARADSSAKNYKLTLGTGVNTNVLEPWSRYDAAGSPTSMRMCTTVAGGAANTYAACFFRPDQDGTRAKWAEIAE